MKKILLIFTVVCMSFSANAQIIKDFTLTNKPTVVTPVILKADPIIKEIISAADEGIYKISMTSSTLRRTKKVNYTGSSWSSQLTSEPGRLYNVLKIDEFSAEGNFYLNDANGEAANVRIYTTGVGGKKMTIKYTKDVKNVITINNLKITKKKPANYIITGESGAEDHITNYIFHVYRHIK